MLDKYPVNIFIGMGYYLYNLRLLALRVALMLALFSLSRMFFYFLNLGHFSELDFSALLLAFYGGLIFDISTVFYLQSVFIFLHLLPFGFQLGKYWQRALFILFIAVGALSLLPNFIDSRFFLFEQKRLTSDIFSPAWLGDDFKTLWPVFLRDFWYIVLSWLAFVAAMWYFYPRAKKDVFESGKSLKNSIFKGSIFLMCAALWLLGARGGIQTKPLRIIAASQYASPKNIPLVLNSGFTLLKTIGNNDIEYFKYFAMEDSLKLHFQKLKIPDSTTTFVPRNVVLIILEGFGSEYIGFFNNGKGYTPCLDTLMGKALVFNRCFANGKKSIEAVPSVLASIPALMNNPFITSSYSSSNINSLASLLKTKGYNSHFFHGGKNGTMGFDVFSKLAGFDFYYGLDQYPHKADYDGNWGIHDEPYMRYVANQLNSVKQPFVACAFTLSSHHPFEIPKEYSDRFPLGTLKIHQSIGYADWALGGFFKAASAMPWYKNTLFVLTADHTAEAEAEYYKGKVGMYAVPLVFYMPSDPFFKGMDSSIVQQADILPSVLDYLNFDKPYVAFGKSIFDTSKPGYSISYLNGIYQIIMGNYALSFDGQQNISLFDYKKDPACMHNILALKPKLADSLSVFLKSVVQEYNYSLLNNQLVP